MAAEKNPGRLAVIERIKEFEKKGWWNKDVEDDPPTVPLQPGQCDYLNKKFTSWIQMKFVNTQARRFIRKLVRTGQMILKPVDGLEKFIAMKDVGAVITCNHFNAFDNFAIYHCLEKYIRRKQLYKVIREGNYTSFPGIYGYFFRHCNTLPLSSNFSVMKEFMSAVDTLLKRGEKLLVYAEQGMWWNYRKPRPMTNGAFRFAVNNNVPVIPLFITMRDTDKIDGDGFPVQEYTLHVLDAIYPDANKSRRENEKDMMENNFRQWKDCYEKFYGIPLTYCDDTNFIGGDKI